MMMTTGSSVDAAGVVVVCDVVVGAVVVHMEMDVLVDNSPTTDAVAVKAVVVPSSDVTADVMVVIVPVKVILFSGVVVVVVVVDVVVDVFDGKHSMLAEIVPTNGVLSPPFLK